LPLPFVFRFFCYDYTLAYVSGNGYLTFNALSRQMRWDGGQTLLRDVLAVLWRDYAPTMAPGGGMGNVYWGVEGVAPARSLVVTWKDMRVYGAEAAAAAAGSASTFQLQLLEGGAVKLLFTSTGSDEGVGAVVGAVGKHPQGAQDLKGSSGRVPHGHGLLLLPSNM
jgi:hypothetical protein